MLVNKSIETANGTVKFEGELEQNELDFVLKIGLNYLLTNGAIPFTTAAKAEGSGYAEKIPRVVTPESETTH
jgi:hypothetical protein